MKKITISLISLFAVTTVAAQIPEREDISISKLTIENDSYTQWVDSVVIADVHGQYFANRFWDNWFMTIGAGGQAYFGDQDGKASFGDRITPAYELSFGKWLRPVWGLRAQVGGWETVGFATAADAPYVSGGPNSKGLYRQEWDKVFFHGDVLVDLNNAIGGYRPDRFYSAIPYAGVGMSFTVNGGKSRTGMGVVGLINRFRISDTFDANLEVKYAFTDSDYDRQTVKKSIDGFLTASVGLTWKIGTGGKRHFQRALSTSTYVTRLYKPDPEVTVVKEVVIEECPAERTAIFFDLGKHDVSERGKAQLSYTADMINQNYNTNFRLVGMADSETGSPELNQQLSQRRAEAVRDILVNTYGVSPSRLTIDALGGIEGKNPLLNRVVIIVPQD